jgi:RHS repeat-associated protein
VTASFSTDSILGAGLVYTATRSFLQFDGFGSGDLLEGTLVHAATLRLWQQAWASCTANDLEVYRIEDPWLGSTVTTWPGPDVVEQVGERVSPAGASCTPQWMNIDVTDAAVNWADGTWDPYGLMVRGSDESDPNKGRMFDSTEGTNGPLLEVVWSEMPDPTESPSAPTSITPVGATGSLTPELSAIVDDPQGDDIRVHYVVREDGARVAAGTGSWDDDGDRSEWTTPTLQWDHTYEIVAIAEDADGYFSAAATPVTFTPTEPTVITDDIEVDTVWDAAHSPYVISDTITIAASLTMLPGTVVKLDDDVSVSTTDQLLVLGTAADPVTLTSYHDDTVGGDTNGTGTAPSPADWGDVTAEGGSLVLIDHAVVRYGGGPVSSTNPCDENTGMLKASGTPTTTFSVTNSVLEQSSTAAVRISGDNHEGAVHTVAHNVIRDSGIGVHVWHPQDTKVWVVNNEFHTFDEHAVCMQSSGPTELWYNEITGTVQNPGYGRFRYNVLTDTGIEASDGADVAKNYWPPPAGPPTGIGDALGAAPDRATPALAEANHPRVGPVDAVTGELVWSESDIAIADAGMDVSLDRIYRSQDAGSGALGTGWSTSFSETATNPGGDGGTMTTASGSVFDFAYDSGIGEVVPTPGNNAAWTDGNGTTTGPSVTTAERSTYAFDASGHLAEVTMRDPGHTVQVDTTGGGLLDLITGVSGRSIDVVNSGSVHDSVTDNQGRTVDYTVSSGVLSAVEGVDGETTTYAYGTGGNLTSVTTAEGVAALTATYGVFTDKTTSYTLAGQATVNVFYDDIEQFSRFVPTTGAATRVDYDDDGRVVAQTIEGFRSTRTIYDGWGRVAATISNVPATSTVGHAPRVAVTTFDEVGDPVVTVDSYGNRTHTTFNADHQPVETRFADDTTVTRGYTGGRMTSFEDQGGEDWDASYNAFGQIVELTDPMTGTGGRVAQAWEYETTLDPGNDLYLGDIRARTNSANETTVYTTTPTGWPHEVTDPLSRTTITEWTAWGAEETITTPEGVVTTISYNKDRQVTLVEGPAGARQLTDYDAAGRIAEVVDAEGHTTPDDEGFTEETTTLFGYDGAGRRVTVTDGNGGITRTTYNAAGDVVTVKEATNAITTNIYHAAGRASGVADIVIDPDGDPSAYDFDREGRLLSTTHPDGSVVSLTYDHMGRQTARSGPRPGTTTTVDYDDLGRPHVVVDAAGGHITLDYDALGNRTSRQDQNGDTTTFTFDDANRPTGASDPEGQLWRATYDDAGQVERRFTGAEDPGGSDDHYTGFTYNDDGHLTTVATQIDGVETTTTFFAELDDAGRPTVVIDPRAFATDVDCRGTDWDTADCNPTVYDYDTLGRVESITHPTGLLTDPGGTVTEEFFYDDNGNQRFWNDRRGEQWEYTFDGNNRPAATIDPAGNHTVTCYQADGDPWLTVDQTGAGTEHVYDTMGRVIEAWVVDGTEGSCAAPTRVGDPDTFAWELDGQPASQDVGGITTTFGYNADGWLIETVDGDGDETDHLAHDDLGRPQLAIDPTDVTTTTRWDARGRVTDTGVHHSTGASSREACANAWLAGSPLSGCVAEVTRSVWDAADQLTEVQHPSWNGTTGRREQLAYDFAGRLTSAEDGLGNTATYQYDDAGNLEEVLTPGAANPITYQYDRAGFLVSEELPGTDPVTYTVDGAGNRTGMTQPSGRETTYHLDALARVEREQVDDGTTDLSRWFGFDDAGRPTTATEAASTPSIPDIEAVYDDAGRPDTIEQGGYTQDLTWDDRGRLAARAFGPTGPTIPTVATYAYDDGPNGTGLLVAIGGDLTIGYEYDVAGRVAHVKSGSADSRVWDSYEYDYAGRVDEHAVRRGATGGWLLEELDYSVDGDITGSTTTIGTTRTADAITYDPAGRLDTLTRSWDADTGSGGVDNTVTVDYGWNARGDRTSADITSGTAGSGTTSLAALGLNSSTNTWDYDDAGRLTDAPGITDVVYDDDGRLTEEQRSSADDTRYHYDLFGDLDSIETGDSSTWTTVHDVTRDALGRPVEVTAGGATTTYVPDWFSSVPARTATTGGTANKVVLDPGGSPLAVAPASGPVERLIRNQHGDVTAILPVVNTSTSVSTFTATYGPFGGMHTTGANATRLGYQGQVQDAANQIVHADARTLHTGYGRFLQADTWTGDNTNPITLNRYTYANASPFTMTDPSGRLAVDTWDGHGEDVYVGNGQTSYDPSASSPALTQDEQRLRQQLNDSYGDDLQAKYPDYYEWPDWKQLDTAAGNLLMDGNLGIVDWDTWNAMPHDKRMAFWDKHIDAINAGINAMACAGAKVETICRHRTELVAFTAGFANAMICGAAGNLAGPTAAGAAGNVCFGISYRAVKSSAEGGVDWGEVFDPKSIGVDASVGAAFGWGGSKLFRTIKNSRFFTNTDDLASAGGNLDDLATSRGGNVDDVAEASATRASGGGGTDVFHATTSPGAAQGVANGINPARLNPNSRFGRAFYAAEGPDTALAEMAHHGASPTHGVRFSLNTSNARVLDLADPNVASAWGYSGGPISSATQAIGPKAAGAGFNAIRYPSLRGGGMNWAILDDFDDLLVPQMITPTG